MDAAHIKFLIQSGEQNHIEFKAGLSGKRDWAISKEVAAFATANGGTIVIGVSNDRQILGIDDPGTTISKIENWISADIEPALLVNVYTASVDGKNVVVVDVPSGTSPFYMAAGRPYIRIGSSSSVLRVAEMIDLVRGRPIEAVISSLESTLAVAQAMASSAYHATAPAIQGQGDLATKSYEWVRQRLFEDLEGSSLILGMKSSTAVANSMANVALVKPATSVEGQSELATMAFEALVERLAHHPRMKSIVDMAATSAAVASSSAALALSRAESIQNDLNRLKAALSSL